LSAGTSRPMPPNSGAISAQAAVRGTQQKRNSADQAAKGESVARVFLGRNQNRNFGNSRILYSDGIDFSSPFWCVFPCFEQFE
jgi:hypothetical protein